METGIGKRIKTKRTELGMTQMELALKMGFVNKSTISKVESGLEDNMTLDRVERYAKALNCTPGYLMGWEDNLTDESARTMAILMKAANEAVFLKKYNSLDDEDKTEVHRLVDFLIYKKSSNKDQNPSD